MNNQQVNRIEGTVEEALPNAFFRVRLENGNLALCHLAGKLRMHRIKVLPGDTVVVEMANPDDQRGRIVYRKK